MPDLSYASSARGCAGRPACAAAPCAFPRPVGGEAAPASSRRSSPAARGVVVISGTNGKTTTAKDDRAAAALQGLRVFTNRTAPTACAVWRRPCAEMDAFGRLDEDVRGARTRRGPRGALREAGAAADRPAQRDAGPAGPLRGNPTPRARMLRQVARAAAETVVLNREDRASRVSPRTCRRARPCPRSALRRAASHVALRRRHARGPAPGGPGRAELQVPSARRRTRTSCWRRSTPAAWSWTCAARATRPRSTSTASTDRHNAAATPGREPAGARDDADVPALVAELGNVTPAFGRGGAHHRGRQAPCSCCW
ncbi:hypothetical protein QJS66_04325 [Kocuria rhizophila]|nr:hypothetical protein QJS66_04325 [Kocuria rhizophila]